MSLFFDSSTPLWASSAIVYGFLLLRYLLLAGGAYFLFWRLLAPKLQPRKIDPTPVRSKDLIREIRWSLATFLNFTANGTFLIWSTRMGWTQLYQGPLAEKGVFHFLLSVAGMLAFHDLYFYVIHRSMHHPLLYRTFHEVHHRSLSPTPFAAFSFHPWEAFVESGVVTLIAFLFPVHLYALFLFQLISLIMNIYGHLGYEFIDPKVHEQHAILKWFNTTRSHQEHHRRFRTNFGLYSLVWDRLLGTYRPAE